MASDRAFNDLLAATVALQRDVAQALDLAVRVLRGPDPALREQALDSLSSLVTVMYESNGRLSRIERQLHQRQEKPYHP